MVNHRHSSMAIVVEDGTIEFMPCNCTLFLIIQFDFVASESTLSRDCVGSVSTETESDQSLPRASRHSTLEHFLRYSSFHTKSQSTHCVLERIRPRVDYTTVSFSLFDARKTTVKRAYQIGVIARDTSSVVSLCAKTELSRIPRYMTRSSTDPLHDLDPKIEVTLHRLRKARNIVVNNSNSPNSVSSSNNSSPTTNNSDSFEYSSTNNFAELEQIENNDRTLKELATSDVVYQLWCIQYPQLEPTQTYELKSSLIHLKRLPQALKGIHVVCSTMRPQGISEDYIKMKAFPFSLDGAAKDWLYLQPILFNTWGDMKCMFREKFFLAS
ncbi:hypothetical protein CR513_41560, partial [Mucuna pruriens]